MVKLNSNSKKAKRLIRKEISSYEWNAKSIKSQVNSFFTYPKGYRPSTPYHAGKKMVEGGSFACYYSQTDDLLGKIYGKDNVKKWSDEKKWNTYTHLISREIDSVYKSGRMALNKPKTKKNVN